jgi:hypothetical protein
VQSLGYVGLRTKSIEDWSGYGTRLLGLQTVDHSPATLALRMNDRKHVEIEAMRLADVVSTAPRLRLSRSFRAAIFRASVPALSGLVMWCCMSSASTK